MAKRDYYEVLDLSKGASEEDIRKNFRKKALEFHPDRNKDPDAEAEVQGGQRGLPDPHGFGKGGHGTTGTVTPGWAPRPVSPATSKDSTSLAALAMSLIPSLVGSAPRPGTLPAKARTFGTGWFSRLRKPTLARIRT